ncbi:cyclic 2,3-diphosphoglycerate synthase [Ancylomarina sp. 16SWW S1-10-2]|uniref:cyclic 2,3-diphosphoglycerate synthase n=1 Tax=Ancylomarina sp. 16SWW S1-10-2 TaxID=2499681 RepID=UPI0012ADAD13|nr:cyclic 2,3-diphosphoglycerate synthase [Ancylomarina sp. 16SWW S1-10-2]MRT91640.1 GTPase [Ancylomarina sp. 16SWW S1-10-2]
MAIKKVIIIGAAGRDFHNFNTYFRNNSHYNVVAFTAAQIPDIDGRKYPKELAGELYPEGIPIFAEAELTQLIKRHEIDDCVFSYSDVSYQKVMTMSAIVNAAGANFKLLGPNDTMIKSCKPVIAVVASRTGCGKSQTSRTVIEELMSKGLRVVAIRHPMPYGDLFAQKVQRFATIDDLKKHKCTIEEMEEYEPHVSRGNIIYAGVDYEAIVRAAEKDPAGCDVIVWDGGNNDFSFYKPDLTITVVDPHRPGTELSYYPGEVNLRLADVVVINKMDSASPEGIQTVRENIAMVNANAIVIDAASPILVNNPDIIKGKRVLIVEDGPTLTHGGMKIGAGTVAARKFGASEEVDARPYLVGKLKETYETYPNIGSILPAMGYSDQQLKDLEATINACDCDSVIIGTPIDLTRIIKINKPYTRVYYDLEEIGYPKVSHIIDQFIKEQKLKGKNFS